MIENSIDREVSVHADSFSVAGKPVRSKEQKRQHLQYLKRKHRAELELLKGVPVENRVLYLKRLELEEDLKRDQEILQLHQRSLHKMFKPEKLRKILSRKC